MRRADRLLQIIQILRRSNGPTTAQAIADELEVVPRTIYRDIATLQASRVPIDGEAGVGYLLRPGYDLPPLMFDTAEIEAIILGLAMKNRFGARPMHWQRYASSYRKIWPMPHGRPCCLCPMLSKMV
jgi:predicted DNA-binding transcriptional regulator YafY